MNRVMKDVIWSVACLLLAASIVILSFRLRDYRLEMDELRNQVQVHEKTIVSLGVHLAAQRADINELQSRATAHGHLILKMMSRERERPGEEWWKF